MDCVVSDIDNDGEKELIAVTYLGDLFVIKKEEVIIKKIMMSNNNLGFLENNCIKRT